MSNSDVIANFINHKEGKTPLRNIINGYYTYKGRTLASDGKLYINREKYSVTTS